MEKEQRKKEQGGKGERSREQGGKMPKEQGARTPQQRLSAEY